MARTYDPTLLANPDVTSLAWALAWVRFTLRDTSVTSGAYSDEEITGALTLTAVSGTDDILLYRPHVVAAYFIETDPHRALSMRADDVAEEFADPRHVAAAIRKSGAAIDALVTLAGGPGRTVARVLF